MRQADTLSGHLTDCPEIRRRTLSLPLGSVPPPVRPPETEEEINGLKPAGALVWLVIRTHETRGPMNQCTARRSDGQPCKAQAIRGGSVCRVHGGSAPQVRRKAAERLATLIDPAIGVLATSMRQRKDRRLALSAAVDVLNRNNLTGKQQIEVSGATNWADVLRARRAKRSARDGMTKELRVRPRRFETRQTSKIDLVSALEFWPPSPVAILN